MRQKHLNTFTGVMNQDTDPLLLQPGDYIDALNLIAGFSGGKQNLESLPGTRAITAPVWPDGGITTVIGACEDKQTEAMYFFLYNDDASPRILKFIDLQSDVQEVQLVATANFGFQKNWRVQSAIVDGKYLYWTDGRVSRDGLTAETSIDGNAPCKLNTVKAIRENNLMDAIIYPDQAKYEGQTLLFHDTFTYSVTILDDLGGFVTNLALTTDGAYAGNPSGFLHWLFEQIEGSDLVDYIQLEECDGCKLKVTSKFFGWQVQFTTSNNDVILVPTGYYPDTLQEQHYRLLKRPPLCPPTVEFTKDPTTAINNVQRSCFQFRVRYIYDDGERTAWGPISNVALNLGIDGLPVDDLNAIQIDFTDEWLSDPNWLCVIEKVEIAVRDGNDGIWKSIKTIERCDLGIFKQQYVWANDQSYAAVASDDGSQGSGDTQVLKLFDEVPLVCGAMATASGTEGDQRLFVGDTLEGFDNPDCVNVDFTIEEYTTTGLVDITGTVRVLDEAGGLVVDPDFHEPYYPLGGFVVYLAGTPYFGVSNNPIDGSGDGSFTIKGVPRGKYIMRVAGHQCGFNDDFGSKHNLNNGLVWQQTSAPVLEVAGSIGATGITTERVIDITTAGATFDLDSEPGYGTIDIQSIFASDNTKTVVEIYALDAGEDLTYVSGNTNWSAFCGKALSAIGVERLLLTISDGVLPPQSMYSDHNGYGFFVMQNSGVALDFGSVGMDDFVFGPGGNDPFVWLRVDDAASVVSSIDNSVAGVGQVFVDLAANSSQQIIMLNSSAAWTNIYRRQLSGRVVDGHGNGVSGVLVMYERNGRQELTDVFGDYNIAIYPPNGGAGAGDRDDDNLYITYPNDLQFIYPPSPSSQLPNIAPFANFVAADFAFGFIGGLSVDGRFLKNGAQYKMGIVYEGKGNQTPGVVPLDTIHIPFCTEDGEIVKHRTLWSITSRPPDWATHYRLVRTKNLVHARYFQWVTDEVKFGIITNPAATPTFSTFSASNWDHIFIRVNSKDVAGDAGNLLLFFSEKKEGYTPLTGDRVRFMLNESSAPVATNKILELNVAGRYIDGDNYYVVIPRVEFNGGLEPQAGWSFEFYTPKGVDEPFYYETGDCFEIGNPGEDDRYHLGQIDNQTPVTGGVSGAATGYLQGGDTYWRFKSFNTVGAGIRFPTENVTVSVYHASGCEDIGRAFIEAPQGQQWRYNRVRYSGLYVPTSDLNGLSSFGSLDYLDINRQFGPIVNLSYAGGILLALAWHKAQSFYLKKGQFLDFRGSTSVGRSDQVMTLADEFRADLGCQHPESVGRDGERVYWWDAYRGRVGRYSQAGVEPIDRGLYGVFQQISTDRKKIPIDKNLVVGAYDRKTNMYLLTFPAYNGVEEGQPSVAANTYAFSELQDGWKTRFSFYPDCYGNVGSDLFMFNSLGVWKAWARTDQYNTFMDVSTESLIRFAANPLPGSVKDWYCISVRTDQKWVAPDISIPGNLNYVSGMASRLKVNRWASYEGDWCADFLRDMNDTSKVFLDIVDAAERARTALLRGRPLKGHVLIVELDTWGAAEAGVQAKIWHVITEYAESQKTGM